MLADGVFPKEPIRQRVLSFPFQLRFLLARHPELMGKVLGVVCRTLSVHLIKQAGFSKAAAYKGAVMLIQRFGSVLNLNVNFQIPLTKIDGSASQGNPQDSFEFRSKQVP